MDIYASNNVLKEKKKMNKIIQIEIYKKKIYIEEENTTGCKYPCKNKQEFLEAMDIYASNYIFEEEK